MSESKTEGTLEYFTVDLDLSYLLQKQMVR